VNQAGEKVVAWEALRERTENNQQARRHCLSGREKDLYFYERRLRRAEKKKPGTLAKGGKDVGKVPFTVVGAPTKPVPAKLGNVLNGAGGLGRCQK